LFRQQRRYRGHPAAPGSYIGNNGGVVASHDPFKKRTTETDRAIPRKLRA
jgi:hypothetical protein